MSFLRPVVLHILLLTLLSGCSGISMLRGGSVKDLYTEDFLSRIESIKEEYRQGRADNALKRLKSFQDDKLRPSEQALRRNLVGVILFSQENYEQAIYNFDLALSSSRLDRGLTAQIYLNLASSYYRLGFQEKALSTLSMGEFKYLDPAEAKKFHMLRYRLASELSKSREEILSLIWYLGDKNSVSELRSDVYFSRLTENFFKLSAREQLKILSDYEDDGLFVVGYLAYLTAQKLYYEGDRDEVDDLLSWIANRFEKNVELITMVENFSFRTNSFSKMNQRKVGVILPLSGDKQEFGQRVMKGIDSGLQRFGFKQDIETQQRVPLYELELRDSQGSATIGAHRVKELVENHHVSVIIGGLFSDEAIEEYRQARRYGVLFISLSEIYLPKDQKDHLLIEVPGSVQSQMGKLFSPKMLDRLGRKVALLYPETERGEAIVDEFWRQSQKEGVTPTGVLSYDSNQTDFRDPVQKLLGLSFPRERQEEYDLLSKVYELESTTSARRVQTLKPRLDFDWAFIASYPQEALQLLPAFTYFDAYDLKLVGGPSWRSRALSQEASQHGNLIFVGDEVSSQVEDFSQTFYKLYKERPRLVEMRSYDAMNISHKLLSQGNYKDREQLDLFVRDKERLQGMTGDWFMEDGIWLKEMKPYKIKRGKIEAFDMNDFSSETNLDGPEENLDEVSLAPKVNEAS
jgi:ABC-type branched-subunit amino acid transport system substrate-binding protein